jgi:hypothetical protein
MSSEVEDKRQIVCSTCGLEAAYCATIDRPYTIEFDSSQFYKKCKEPNPRKSFHCLKLDLCIAVAGQSPSYGSQSSPAGEDIVDRES